jgi:hypothetical protein
LAVLATVSYFFLFSLTRTTWLGAFILAAFVAAILPFAQMRRGLQGALLVGSAAVLAAAAGIAEYKLVSTGNALLVIEPYRSGKGWAFDEPSLGLRGEPFVQGVPEMIDRLVTGIPGSEKNVRLIFSQRRFPGAQLELDRQKEQDGGNWYYSKDYEMEGWLCPALFKYFPRAPQHIYVRAEQK